MNNKSDRVKLDSLDGGRKRDDDFREDITSALKNSFSSHKFPDKELDELFTLIQLINNVLSSNTTLSKQQVLDYCKSQRYFMKLYMKKVMDKNGH